MDNFITKDLTIDDTYSDSVSLSAGYFSFSISGVFVATITVQRSWDECDTWDDVQDFSEPGEWTGHEGSGAHYRAGIKTGNFTSGTATVRIKE